MVLYLENHSFDNLYGEFDGGAGLASAAATATQVDPDGGAYASLPQPTDTSQRAPGLRGSDTARCHSCDARVS